jgi:hypothetical protein
MGERGGKRDGLRIERNSSSASEGKLDLIRKNISKEERVNQDGKEWDGDVGKYIFTLEMHGETPLGILNQGPGE